jgi:hypothetical protein
MFFPKHVNRYFILLFAGPQNLDVDFGSSLLTYKALGNPFSFVFET